MQAPSITVPPESIRIRLIQPGGFRVASPSGRHTKVTPSSIIAQAVTGSYEVRRDCQCVNFPEGMFLAQAGDRLDITHHVDPVAGVMEARWLHCTIELFETVDLLSLYDLPLGLDRAASAPFDEPLAQLLADRQETGLDAALRRQRCCLEIVERLCHSAPLSPWGAALLGALPRLQPLLRLINQEYDRSITVAEMALSAGMSRSRLFTCCRETLHCTPLEYLKEVRIRRACLALIWSDDPVYRIATAVGFSNPYHFGREFKRLQGLSPGRYRQFHRHHSLPAQD